MIENNIISISKMFIDEFGSPVDLSVEAISRELCSKYIKPTDHVLEFGARYGTISVFLSKALNSGSQLVSVEPDSQVLHCLQVNKQNNGADFHIVNGVVSNTKQYLIPSECIWEQRTTPELRVGTEIPTYTLKGLEQQFSLKFNVFVANCEGYLIEFYQTHPEFFDQLDIIIYEEDAVSWHPIKEHYVEYDDFEVFLTSKGFRLVEDKVDPIGLHNKVWIKP